jgi:hypothetical protein
VRITSGRAASGAWLAGPGRWWGLDATQCCARVGAQRGSAASRRGSPDLFRLTTLFSRNLNRSALYGK